MYFPKSQGATAEELGSHMCLQSRRLLLKSEMETVNETKMIIFGGVLLSFYAHDPAIRIIYKIKCKK